MNDPRPPRLLVTLPPRAPVDQAIGRQLPDLPWVYAERSSPQEWGSVEAILTGTIERELGSYDRNSTPHLRFVQRIFTGLDGFPFGWFGESVRIAGNIGAYAPFVAEHAVALALAAARDLRGAHEKVRAGQLRPPPEQRLFFGRTAVILGYGEIGRAIAARLAGFGMRVLGVNRGGRMTPGVAGMYPADAIAEALAQADFIFEARPLTRATRGSLNAELLAAMRPNAVFVNVGRGATVDEEALFHHLKEHPEFRAALDVWWDEDFAGGRLGTGFPFAELPNFLGTPHTAGLGPGVEPHILAKALENLDRFFRGEEPQYVTDPHEYGP